MICSCIRCCVVVFFRILVCLGRVWTLLGSILAPFALHLGSIWAPFWLPLASMCCHLRAGGDTRSVRNYRPAAFSRNCSWNQKPRKFTSVNACEPDFVNFLGLKKNFCKTRKKLTISSSQAENMLNLRGVQSPEAVKNRTRCKVLIQNSH